MSCHYHQEDNSPYYKTEHNLFQNVDEVNRPSNVSLIFCWEMLFHATKTYMIIIITIIGFIVLVKGALVLIGIDALNQITYKIWMAYLRIGYQYKSTGKTPLISRMLNI